MLRISDIRPRASDIRCHVWYVANATWYILLLQNVSGLRRDYMLRDKTGDCDSCRGRIYASRDITRKQRRRKVRPLWLKRGQLRVTTVLLWTCGTHKCVPYASLKFDCIAKLIIASQTRNILRKQNISRCVSNISRTIVHITRPRRISLMRSILAFTTSGGNQGQFDWRFSISNRPWLFNIITSIK